MKKFFATSSALLALACAGAATAENLTFDPDPMHFELAVIDVTDVVHDAKVEQVAPTALFTVAETDGLTSPLKSAAGPHARHSAAWHALCDHQHLASPLFSDRGSGLSSTTVI